MNRLQMAEQFRKALQMFAASLDEEKAMEVAAVFDAWKAGKAYAAGEFVTYGVNGVSDPQLYRVVQSHIAQEGWMPDTTPALYEVIGLNKEGYPLWSAPSGAHDSYKKGDVVDYQGRLYVSTMDGNIYSPESYPAGWATYDA